jgi:hypothetical protein
LQDPRTEAALNVSRARARAGVGNFIAHIVRDPMELLRLPGEALEKFIRVKRNAAYRSL